MTYQIQVNIADEWEPGEWETVDGDLVASGREPVTYATKTEADAAIADHFAEMLAVGMDFEPADWRVAEVAA